MDVTGWSRKHADKVLLGRRREEGKRGKRGARLRDGAGWVAALKECWLSMDQACGKRVKGMLLLWVAHLQYDEAIRAQRRASGASTTAFESRHSGHT
ncbi:MAG: hypothetical protein Q7Q71_06435 [Verrucomicrobiota bacterium JB023]|nr:hypothetical protein [Verrucomicrobiota bacterium JB023]